MEYSWRGKMFLTEDIKTLDSKMEELVKANPHYHWCGIYRVEGDNLVLTCYRGAPTPHSIIPKGEGICGAAVRENQTLNIRDVKSDPRYLSCDIKTKSELVVPIRNPLGEPIGEIDIDSHFVDAFTQKDIDLIEKTAIELAPILLRVITS